MKRLIDISISSGLLLIFFPLLLIISLANIFFHNGKIFFIQDRAGYNGNVFKIVLNLFTSPYFSFIGNLGNSNLFLVLSITPECWPKP